MELLTMFIVPALMLIMACLSKYRPPKKINSLYGYRSRRSKASQESWDLAQQLMVKYLFIIGAAEVVLTAICCLFIRNATSEQLLLIMVIVTAVQVIGLLLVIPLVEKDLKEAE